MDGLKKIKGSSLIEVIVAMTILAVTVTATFTVVSNYQRTGSTRLKNIARGQIENVEKETMENEDYLDETIDLGYIRIEKKTENFRKSDNLIQLTIEAYDKKEKRIAYKKVLIKTDNEE